MSTYLLIDGQQQGPYSPDQLREMLSSSAIGRDCLAWRVGLSEWRPLHSILSSWQTRQRRDGSRSLASVVGLIGLGLGAIGVVAWPMLLVASSVTESEAVLALVGLGLLAGLGFNLLGTVFGGVALLSSKANKAVAIIGLGLNVLQLLAMVFLLFLGLAVEASVASEPVQ